MSHDPVKMADDYAVAADERADAESDHDAAGERLEKIRARVARLRAAGPIDVAADPALNDLRMIAKSDADDLAYLLEENEQLRRERDEARQRGIEDQVAADVHTWEATERELEAVAAERDQLQSDLAAAHDREKGLKEAAGHFAKCMRPTVRLDRNGSMFTEPCGKCDGCTLLAALAPDGRDGD